MATTDRRRGRLPVPPTPLFGREADIEAARELLDEHRLVTLTGAGGSGKTRLAIALATAHTDESDVAATFAPLQDARDHDEAAEAIEAALGINDRSESDHVENIVAFLGDRDVLLVLDNFEQLLPAASLVSDLLAGAQGTRIIVTSRAPLRIAGEREFEVLPLEHAAATALFAERAAAVRSGFDRTHHEAAVEDITERLDGLPLAVELAAAQVRMLTPEAILERLEVSLPVLSGGQRDAPARQRTQRATLDWSHDLLDPEARRLFACLSVFAGGWTLGAAEWVCASPDDRSPVYDRLTTLVEHSLVRPDDTAGPEPRYEMLNVTREYAAERLAEGDEEAGVRRRHAAWVADLVETAEPELVLADLRVWQERLRREDENIRAALTWAIKNEEALLAQRLAGSLWRYWHHWGEFREGISWLEAVRAISDTSVLSEPVARALSSLAGLLWHQGHGAESLTLYERVVEMYRALGDDVRLRDALDDASWAAVMADDPDLAMRLTHEKWEYPPRPRSIYFDGWIGRDEEMAFRDYLWRGVGSYEVVGPLEAVIDTIDRSDQALFAAHIRETIFGSHYPERPDLGYRRCREALQLYHRLGHIGQLVVALGAMANVEYTAGHPERAVRLAAAGNRRAGELGGVVGSHGGPNEVWRDYTAGARTQLSAEGYARAVAEGRAMTLDEAVAFALSKASSGRSKGATRGRDPDALTPREEEVLALLAEGRTDPEIGEALFISPKTASSHVASIKGKLGAGSRAEIVSIAIRGGLVVDDAYE